MGNAEKRHHRENATCDRRTQVSPHDRKSTRISTTRKRATPHANRCAGTHGRERPNAEQCGTITSHGQPTRGLGNSRQGTSLSRRGLHRPTFLSPPRAPLFALLPAPPAQPLSTACEPLDAPIVGLGSANASMQPKMRTLLHTLGDVHRRHGRRAPRTGKRRRGDGRQIGGEQAPCPKLAAGGCQEQRRAIRF